MKKNKIATYYHEKMAIDGDIKENFSKSPQKPKRLIEYLTKKNLIKHFEIRDFEPFKREDFLIAHTDYYVDSFFNGVKPICEENGLIWTPQFAESVKYTNASLYNAILNSIKNPNEVSFSPTSGFHHATPHSGCGFCTFSGQVIASVKIYREYGMRGAYIDLDGHFGNSIEDSRDFVYELNDAIPLDCNININTHQGDMYILKLESLIERLKQKILNRQIDYVVFAHGADSHEWDDIGGGCTTNEWIHCSRIVYNMIKEVENEIGSFPLILSLFGGYRKDDYNSVLSLHTMDLVECLNTLCQESVSYKSEVKPRKDGSLIYSYHNLE